MKIGHVHDHQVPNKQSIFLENDIFPTLIGSGLFGVVGDGAFIDIGTPASYNDAELFLRDLNLL